MIARPAIVAAARSWLGTPFHHQGRVKGVGVDCAGLILGVAAELGIVLGDLKGYGRQPDGEELLLTCRRQGHEIAPRAALPGDVYLIALQGRPQHLAFATDRGIIHALAQQRRVVEHRLDLYWAATIAAAFVLPGVGPGVGGAA